MNLEAVKNFNEKELVLENKKNGEKKTFLLRPYKEGDEEGIIECITSEYGDTYFKRSFYDKEKLKAKALGEDYTFFVAECLEEKRILGILVFSFFIEEDYVEPCSEIFHKDVRGFGLAEEFVKYTFPLAKSVEPACLFVHAVTFHDVTQKICERQGMIPVGFRLGSFRLEVCENSYLDNSMKKQSEGIMILPVKDKEAGKIFVPEELKDFCEKKYGELKVSVEIETTKADINEDKEAVIKVTTDDRQRMELIKIEENGKDLISKISERIEAHKNEDQWCYQVTLPVDTAEAVKCYEDLKEIGFFFTGLKPVCGDKECIYMQYVGELDLQMDKYSLSEEYQKVREVVEGFYKKRKL